MKLASIMPRRYLTLLAIKNTNYGLCQHRGRSRISPPPHVHPEALTKKEHTLDGVKYFIDFGEDSHSAAYIVCEILKKLGFRQDFDIITETLDANEIEMSDDFVGIYVATKSITKKETKRKILIRLLLAIAMLIVFIIVQILL